MSFIDEYCTVFDDEDENKLEFTKIHNVSLCSLIIWHSPALTTSCSPFLHRILKKSWKIYLES